MSAPSTTTTTPPVGDTPVPAAETVDAVKAYGAGEAEVRALDGVSVAFERGRFTAIMGPSGSGKSTLDICTLWHTLACDCNRHPSRLQGWRAGRLRHRRRHGSGRRLLPDLR